MSFCGLLDRIFVTLESKTRVQKESRHEFVRTVNTFIFLMLFVVLGGLGSPMGFQMDAWGGILKTLLAQSWRLSDTF